MENNDKIKISPKNNQKLKEIWPELTLFERFEYIVMLFVSVVLAVIILIALFRLIENVYQLLISQIVHKTDFKAFQTTFGMLFDFINRL